MSDIRGVALSALRHPDTGASLVQRLPGTRDGLHFHRFIGGGIHAGEPSDAALEREFREELGVAIEAGPAVCTVENRFEYEAYWRTLSDLRAADAPFFPAGVADALESEGHVHLVSPPEADAADVDD